MQNIYSTLMNVAFAVIVVVFLMAIVYGLLTIATIEKPFRPRKGDDFMTPSFIAIMSGRYLDEKGLGYRWKLLKLVKLFMKLSLLLTAVNLILAPFFI